METISRAGVAYRTRGMELEAAARFARCLRANSRFQGVELREIGRAKSERKWFVSYIPANIARVVDMIRRQQDARAERASEQPFTFVEDRDSSQPFAWCHSHRTGETYEVSVFDCTCGDFRYRLEGTGVRCKHMIALSAAVEAGQIGAFSGPLSSPSGPTAEEQELAAEMLRPWTAEEHEAESERIMALNYDCEVF